MSYRETDTQNGCKQLIKEDWEITNAETRLTEMFISPTRRFMLNAKQGLEKMGNHIATTEITDGTDGNFATLSTGYTRLGKIREDFNKLEQLVEDEEGVQTRGNKLLSDI